MARYNTSLESNVVSGATTISSPNFGNFTQLTGTAPYTVVIPDPTLFPGDEQKYYNSTVGIVTLSSPNGIFTGTGGPGTSTYSIPPGGVLNIVSNGTNYVVISEDGSPLVATTGQFSGDVTANGSGATVSLTAGVVTIAPTGSGSINNTSIGVTNRSSGAFTSLTANQATTLTANIASSSTTTGTLVVTGGLGVSGTVTATNLTGTLQTAAQPNITSVGTLSSLGITNGGTVAGRYLHYQLAQDLGNEGVYQGYLLLAKAYVSGLQSISYVKGYFTMTRGSVTSGNKSDIFYVNSQSAYNSDTLFVSGSTNGGFWSRTCKVTYGGVVYHAIETGAGGGGPDNGVFFTGEFTNCSPIFTDARSVSNVTAYGNSNLFNANDGSGWNNGTYTVGRTTPLGSSQLTIYKAGVSSISNTDSSANGHITLAGTDALVRMQLGTMSSSPFAGWIQASFDNTGGNTGTEPLQLNPSGGNVGINMGLTTAPATRLNINHGAGSAAGDGVLRIGGTNNYASLELGIKGGYDGMIRTYGNDLHIYAGHWRDASTATENHNIYFYTSQNGSTNWSTPKMTLSNAGNLTVTGTITESSSITLKENIRPIENALDSVLKLVGKIYDRKDNQSKDESGLIAEEVFNVLPNLVETDTSGNPTGVKYTKIIAYLIESIKDLNTQISALRGN